MGCSYVLRLALLYTVCLSFRFLHIYCFAHLIVLHFLFHCTFYSYFSFFTIYMLLCCITFISFFIILHCPLSGPDLMYISHLIIPCIIYYVTNKETLTLPHFIYLCLPFCQNEFYLHFSSTYRHQI